MAKKTKKVVSLLGVFDKINAKYLGGLCCAGIQWKRLTTKEDCCILGLADFDTRIISINSVLQHPDVPDYVLEATVLHECLHLIYTPYQAEVDGHAGRDANHSDRFRAIEKRFDIIDKANKWEDPHLHEIVEEYNEKHKKRLTK